MVAARQHPRRRAGNAGLVLSKERSAANGRGGTMTHFADRLADAVQAKGNAVCVGLDPRWEALPHAIRACHGDDIAAAYEAFCGRVLDIVAPLVPVVKPQAAFFEACGPDGMAAMQ